MQVKIRLAGMMIVASMLITSGIAVFVNISFMSGSGLASSQIEQPPMTSYMRSVVDTPDELSPLAPAEAKNVQKVGNHWTCEINGQPMVYNDAASRWEPRPQEVQKK